MASSPAFAVGRAVIFRVTNARVALVQLVVLSIDSAQAV